MRFAVKYRGCGSPNLDFTSITNVMETTTSSITKKLLDSGMQRSIIDVAYHT